MRLIDADAIKTVDYSGLAYILPSNYEGIADYFYKQLVKNQPTAYDVDNVVEEIEEYKNDMKNEWEYYSTTHNGMLAEYYRGRYNSAVYLLEKVKECGRDDK